MKINRIISKAVSGTMAAVMLALSLTSCGKTDGSGAVTTENGPESEVITTCALTTEEITTMSREELEAFVRADCFGADKIEASANIAVVCLVSNLRYYGDVQEKARRKGEKWGYCSSEKYVPQMVYFDAMVLNGKCGANCGHPVIWALKDIGAMPVTKQFYGSSNGTFAKYDDVAPYLTAVCEITDMRNRPQTFNTLYQAGKIKAGDFFLAHNHTFVYIGSEQFLAAGHESQWHTDNSVNFGDSRNAVFDKWLVPMKSCSDYTYTVYWKLRLKDDYVPQYYRNKEGKLVLNPLYDPETCTAYNWKKGFEYNQTGKKNVLETTCFSRAYGFNFSDSSANAAMTDGNIYNDNTTITTATFKMSGGVTAILKPKTFYDANGNSSKTKDGTYKYLCGLPAKLDGVYEVDSFALYTPNTVSTGLSRIGDIEGFDILVSEDGKNWQVAYSAVNVSSGDKWTECDDERNRSSNGTNLTHYIMADFDRTYRAQYVMFAVTYAKAMVQNTNAAHQYTVDKAGSESFSITELQIYEAEK